MIGICEDSVRRNRTHHSHFVMCMKTYFRWYFYGYFRSEISHIPTNKNGFYLLIMMIVTDTSIHQFLMRRDRVSLQNHCFLLLLNISILVIGGVRWF